MLAVASPALKQLAVPESPLKALKLDICVPSVNIPVSCRPWTLGHRTVSCLLSCSSNVSWMQQLYASFVTGSGFCWCRCLLYPVNLCFMSAICEVPPAGKTQHVTSHLSLLLTIYHSCILEYSMMRCNFTNTYGNFTPTPLNLFGCTSSL